MDKTIFFVKDMDCAAEEQTIRMKFADNAAVKQLCFDLENRRLTVFHTGELQSVKADIDSLNFGAEITETEAFTGDIDTRDTSADTKLLWTVLLINFGIFAIEITAGLIAHSMGLVADSLDELADALVYALSIYAVTGTVLVKKRIARASGVLQLVLALWGFSEIVRRFIGNEPAPNFIVMIALSSVALAGNAASLHFLSKSKTKEVHIKATQIFTSNDVIVNIGVIVAAVLVAVLQNKIPDLVIGAVVFAIVLRGAVTIFKLSK
ncbi:MAG: cation transporter [Clostridiales bacterium]|jgi:Co/Zn/Cd efflux system component|nr:cation transporter [Clostridiales bacterium]